MSRCRSAPSTRRTPSACAPRPARCSTCPSSTAGETLEAIAALRAAGYRTLAADVTPDSTDLFTAEREGLLGGRIAWVLGNEAHGLPAEVLGSVDHVVRIPLLGRAESLNLATAAAVCLYAKARLTGLGPSTP